MKRKCPTCKGSGEVPFFKTLSIEKKIKIAKSLRNGDVSIRAIMRLLGYKSPKSVQDLLNK